MSKKIKHLIVDTTAFIKAANLQNMAENMYTIQEVIDEITNDRQRRKLVVLPYDLKVKDVFTENIKVVTDFSKKTGDYSSLSATDIKVMALSYQLEKEKVGTAHLKTEPTMQRTLKVTGIIGFNVHPNDEKDGTAAEKSENSNLNDKFKHETDHLRPDEIKALESSDNLYKDKNNSETILTKSNSENEITTTEPEDDITEKDIVEQINQMNLKDEELDNIIVKVDSVNEEEEEESTEKDSDSDSDGGEWITPGNLSEKKKEVELGEFEDKDVEVACITSDFAMQNVLKQMGLNVTAIDGRVIKQLRTFIFRCTTCFKTTSVMTKLFCPKCGHATLKKVGVSIDNDGNQHIHINGRKPLSAKGKKFSLPTPKGGQHFQYPILTEDQHIHKRFATKLARNKTNAMDPDYIAGFSPFVMKDVNSKSAVLGVRANKQDIKYWMKHHSKGKK